MFIRKLTSYIAFLCLLVSLGSIASASPILYQAAGSAYFSTTATVTYTFGTGSDGGITSSSWGIVTYAPAATGTVQTSVHTAPPSLTDNKLYLDLSQIATSDPFDVTRETTCSQRGNGHTCGADPPFTAAPGDLFVRIWSSSGSVSFPSGTTSLSGYDISALADDFLLGHTFYIGIATQDEFSQPAATLSGWKNTGMTDTVSQTFSSTMSATIYGFYDSGPAASGPAASVPEPLTFALLGLGLTTLGLCRRFAR